MTQTVEGTIHLKYQVEHLRGAVSQHRTCSSAPTQTPMHEIFCQYHCQKNVTRSYEDT